MCACGGLRKPAACRAPWTQVGLIIITRTYVDSESESARCVRLSQLGRLNEIRSCKIAAIKMNLSLHTLY